MNIYIEDIMINKQDTLAVFSILVLVAMFADAVVGRLISG